jgi:hypothetical protein
MMNDELWLKKSAVIDLHPTSCFQHLSLCKHEEIWQLIRSNHPLVILKTAGKAHTGKFMQFRLAIGICAGFLSQRAVVISIVSALSPGAIAYREHSLGGKGIKKLLYTWHLNRSVTSCWPMGSSQSSGPSGCKVRNRLGCPVTLAAPRDCRIEFWRDLLSKFEQEYDGLRWTKPTRSQHCATPQQLWQLFTTFKFPRFPKGRHLPLFE